MTQDEIIEMTKQAGWSGIYTQWAEPTGEADWSPYKVSLTVPVTMEQIEAFAKLVAEKERKACAEICNSIRYEGYVPPEDGAASDYYNEAAIDCAELIRARGQE